MAVRVLLLADTHGPPDPRVAGLAAGCDLVVHAGDVGPPAWLRELGTGLRVVRGNNDRGATWPETAAVPLPGGLLVAVHGHRHGPPARRHARLRQAFPEARAVVYGHSHRQVVDTDGLPWVLNPGAGGRVRTHGGPGCLVLVAAATGWRVEAHRFLQAPRRRGGAAAA